MMTKAELKTATVILEEESKLRLVGRETGEVMTEFSHKPGVYDGAFFERLVPTGYALDGDGVVMIPRGGNTGIVRIKAPIESGANVDYVRRDPLQLMKAELMAQINAVARRDAAKRADLIGAETPKANAQDELEVIEEEETSTDFQATDADKQAADRGENADEDQEAV